MAKRSNQSNEIVRSGELLIEQFRSALITRATVSEAKQLATQTEQQTLQHLAAIPSANVFVTPQDIPPEMKDEITRSSVDAHLQKVQSEQMAAHGTVYLKQIETETLQQYKGRSVRIKVSAPQL